VSALLVTAPLLSPQFLVWLTPWAALVVSGPSEPSTRTAARAVAATAAAATLTGLALHGFGPADLSSTVPAALLTVRNLALLGLVALCLSALRTVPDGHPRPQPGVRVSQDHPASPE
jgi:hypothetical protein